MRRIDYIEYQKSQCREYDCNVLYRFDYQTYIDDHLSYESIIPNTRKVNVERMFATFYIDLSYERVLNVVYLMNQLSRIPEKSMTE